MRIKLISIIFCVVLVFFITGCKEAGIELIEGEGPETEIGVETGGEGQAPGEAEGEKTYTIGGNVSGLSGTLILQNNGADDLNITAAGSFIFATPLADGASYAVTIATQPSPQTCLIKNNTGTVAGANVTDVDVKCLNPGSLDPSFDQDGIVIHKSAAGGDGQDRAHAIAIDSKDRIVVAGTSYNGSNMDMAAWRYNEDGTIDTSFNGTGFVVHDNAANGNKDDYGWGVAVDANDRVLVAGYSWNSLDNDIIIWRYKEDGTLDPSFDGDGILLIQNAAGGNKHDEAFAITIDANNKILVTGWSTNASNNLDLVVIRLNENGTFDNSFDGDGIRVHDNAAGGNGHDRGYAITTDANGKILVAGRSWKGLEYDMTIWRFKENGALDNTFGGGAGFVLSHNAAGGGTYDDGFDIAVDGDGKILVAGASYNGSDEDMVVWRYNADGTPDASFGTNGKVVNDKGAGGGSQQVNNDDFGYAITTDQQNRVLVAGWSVNPLNNASMVIWRFNTNGTPDTSFGTNGKAIYNNEEGAGNKNDTARAIIIDSKGRIVAAGHSATAGGNYDMAIWRYMP